MNAKGAILGGVAVFAAFLAVGGLFADEPKKPTREDIEKKMIEVHKGGKSPLYRIEDEITDRFVPDWDQVAKDTKSLQEMADLLKARQREVTVGEDRYAEAVAALRKAAEAGQANKDNALKDATVALKSLRASCGVCHYGGKPRK